MVDEDEAYTEEEVIDGGRNTRESRSSPLSRRLTRS